MANQVFTDAQINEILNIFRQHMEHRQYIGARYVPIFGRVGETSIEWDNSAPYEPLTIVLYQGNSFTSRQYVPAGIDINNTEFWAETGNYNAQIEQYRQEVLGFYDDMQELKEDIETVNGNIIYSLMPNIIGSDYAFYNASGDSTHFSAVCEHNGIYYGVFPTGVTSGDDAGLAYLRQYNKRANTITEKGTAELWHANSICYVDSNDMIYACANTAHIAKFDSTFALDRIIPQPQNQDMWGISYDSKTNKLYGLANEDTIADGKYTHIVELDVNTLDIINSYRIDFQVFDGYTLQDMAIDDGKVYLSLPNGYFAIIDLETNTILNLGHVSQIDATFARRMGELEGWEFNDVGELVCAYNMTKGNCAVGHTVKIFNKETIHRNNWYTFNDGIGLNATNRYVWYTAENQIKCLNELITFAQPYVGTVDVFGTIPVSTGTFQIILDSIVLRIAPNATFNTREIRPLKGDLTVFVEASATLNFVTNGTPGIRTDVARNCRLTFNALYGSTITHTDAATKATIQPGYNKNPLTIGNLGGNTVTLDLNQTNIPATENTIYLGSGFKIQATAV